MLECSVSGAFVASDEGMRELGQVRYGAVDVPQMGVRGLRRKMRGAPIPDR
jgi:hypothetical protein